MVGLEIIDGFSTGLRCSSLKRSLSRRVLFGAVVAVYHVNDVFGVTVNVISDRSGFACSVECVWRLSFRYVVTSATVFSAWVWAPGLVELCEISKFGPNYKITEVTTTSISYNGCSFKDVIATGGWNKDLKVFAKKMKEMKRRVGL